MLNNLAIELTANFTIIFTWKGDTSSNVWFTLIGEDPVSGAPFVFSNGPVRGLRNAASEAWRFLAESTMWSVYSADPSIRSVGDVWTRDYGTNFSRAIALARPGVDPIAGVSFCSFHEDVKKGKMPLE